jgi:hypothetical protein
MPAHQVNGRLTRATDTDSLRVGAVPLGDMVAALAVDAVNVQRLFDRAHDQDLLAVREALPLLTAVLGTSAVGLFPARLVIDTFDVEVTVRLAVERTRGVEVKVAPLNLGYALRYGSTAEAESRMRFRVARAAPRRMP